MAEDQKTLWVGNLDEKVNEELLYEMFLQTGPIEKLIFPTEGEKDEAKHKGHAYVVFKHPESVQYAAQVLEGSSLFSQALSLKARSLPIQYKKAAPQPTSTFSPSSRGGRFDRFDNSSLRGGFSFNKSSTWHGQNSSFVPRGRGGTGYRGGRGGYSNYSQQSNNSYSGYHNSGSGGREGSYDRSSGMDEKRQRLLQQQNMTLDAHRQIQQGVANMANQTYNTQQQWSNSNSNNMAAYNTSGGGWNNTNAGSWSNQGGMGDQSNMYQGYSSSDQYGGWYQSQ
ncbi:RNA-binding protein 7 [Elysia marginata]|uniref:RNA-binding protein 7 n=1 Tax=Elysia marginata TaxID=1093978 RepID=A0AAV4IYR7_9GAST|nr:RNA-binding protein 7 [Elysia marginata]